VCVYSSLLPAGDGVGSKGGACPSVSRVDPRHTEHSGWDATAREVSQVRQLHPDAPDPTLRVSSQFLLPASQLPWQSVAFPTPLDPRNSVGGEISRLSCSAAHGRARQDTAGLSRTRQGSAEHGRIRQDTEGHGRARQDTAGWCMGSRVLPTA
jgi:hypothetical protein